MESTSQITDLRSFVHDLPKAELHLHLEGSFEPELMFEIAERNRVKIPYNSVQEVKDAYRFTDLQSFLDIYYAGAQVLRTERDFYDLTYAYLSKSNEQNVRHVEVFFDPQTHTHRGVPYEAVVSGIRTALLDGRRDMDISFKLILSFLRHLPESDAMAVFDQALACGVEFDGVGLDSSELGHPPSKFERVFAKARAEGFRPVAHAGEEGPAAYIREALDLLKVVRIDHGNNAVRDRTLLERLAAEQIPLTLCPLSNVELKVVDDLGNHPLRTLMNAGVVATINSDDPAYFGGYMNENLLAVAEAMHLTRKEITDLTRNGFKASWLPEDEKLKHLAALDAFTNRAG